MLEIDDCFDDSLTGEFIQSGNTIFATQKNGAAICLFSYDTSELADAILQLIYLLSFEQRIQLAIEAL
ncbi:hypothetical protein M2404_003847 [Rheinheimera pacifica]|uniref:hypothetical protein n=1 Tax=Rheinheimera pacifica TaxID=173990 RepID=UPI0021682556|nr:hypothetical protein [Rheinheimera pacifica]MCS4309475.1 hypothetical protein [Rheinheimera pacifica]